MSYNPSAGGAVADGSITTAKLGGDITTAGKALLDDADAAAQRTTLGLGTAATSAAGDFAAASHSHSIADVTGLQTALDGKQTAGSYAAASHTHAAADIASGTVATARLGSGTANSTTFLRGDQTWAAPTASVAGTTVEINLGSTWRTDGRFTITDAAITASSKVLCWQAPGPYTGKGTSVDQPTLEPVQVIAVTPATGSATVYWQTPPQQAVAPLANRSPNFGGGTAANSGTNRDLQFTALRLGRVRGNIKFTYLVLG